MTETKLCQQTADRSRVAPIVLGLLALIGLNLLLGLENFWPTALPRATTNFAVETLVLMLVVAVVVEWQGVLSSRAAGWLAAAVIVLVLCRYGQVTLAGLFGRPPDLYWDLRQVPGLLRLLDGLLPTWHLLLLALALILLLSTLFLFVRSLLKLFATSLAVVTLRRGLAVVAVALLAVAVFAPASGNQPTTTVLGELGRQVALLWRYSTQATPVPPLANGPLPALFDSRGTRPDVFMIFWESYGAVVDDQTRFAPALTRHRKQLAGVLAAHGWQSASGLVGSPTFGGGSWFAHASLLTGRTITGEASYQSLLGAKPTSLLDRFGSAGYRRVALMPGLKGSWPEGRRLGFDVVYDDDALDYHGRNFGWWRIPDQVSLERLFQWEIRTPDRAPLFVLFPSIMSHIPFAPTPPYQKAWEAVLDPNAYAPKSDAPDGGYRLSLASVEQRLPKTRSPTIFPGYRAFSKSGRRPMP